VSLHLIHASPMMKVINSVPLERHRTPA